MTGFASIEGAGHGWRWSWELRGVNARGLDIRLRLPDWPGGLDSPVREAVGKAARRGAITVGLRLQSEGQADTGRLNTVVLDHYIATLREVEERALSQDLSLHPARASELLQMRGVLDNGADDADPEPLREAVLADLAEVVAAFDAMRAGEGAALETVLSGQIDTIAASVAEARALLPDRAAHLETGFRAALARVVENADGVDEARVAQELAQIAVKADVAEELDRLDAHVAAARDLLAGDGPKGRKLDFLTQEFNREANTLCSKAGFAGLTRVGLDLKHTIDQMREQVQNVE